MIFHESTAGLNRQRRLYGVSIGFCVSGLIVWTAIEIFRESCSKIIGENEGFESDLYKNMCKINENILSLKEKVKNEY